MNKRAWLAPLLAMSLAVVGCTTDKAKVQTTAPKVPPPGTFADRDPVSAASLGIDLAKQTVCDPIGGPACMLPFPNDHFTVSDDHTETGRHLHFDRDQMPANSTGVRVDPAAWEGSDGFSPGSPVLVELAGLDPRKSKLAPITDIASSLSADAPIVVWDATAKKRHPYWAELDSLADDGSPTLIVHPAVNFPEGHRIVVGIRHTVDASGAAIAPNKAFEAYRDAQRTTDATFEARRTEMEETIATLGTAGVKRNDLQLAWSFTIGSARSIAGRLLAMRDDAFKVLGDDAPKFTVTSVVEHPKGDPRIFRLVDGTFETPLYLTGTGEPGSSLVLDANGVPQRQAGVFTSPFRCVIPPGSAHDSDAGPAVASRMSLYGHGLLGDLGEVTSHLVVDMANANNIVYCASNLSGMAEEDTGNAIAALGDLSKFSTLPDRLQEGILAFHFLGRLLKSPKGLTTADAFRVGGKSVLKTDELYYDGNSQGAILGGAIVATSVDIKRAVLGEAGMNYALLLDRSVDFDDYALIFKPAYPKREDRLLLLTMISILWDRGEADGYAEHLTDNPLPGTPKHTVLLVGAVGDHQVTEYSLRVEARTAGVPARFPLAAEGRISDGAFGLQHATVGSSGSVYALVDTGSPASPLTNEPSRSGHDPHDDTPNVPEVQQMKDAFMRTDGTYKDTCGTGKPCVFPVPAANAD